VPSPNDGAGTRSLLFLALSLVAGVIVAGLALPAVGLVGLTAKRGAENFQSLPAQLSVPPLQQRSRLLAADGTVIATFYSQNRVYVPMNKIAKVMQDAIVATEDARFYEHNGIDLRGTLRALLANTQAGGVTQGGSTITQQYVKNVLADTATSKEERDAALEDSLSRKLRELRYALGLEETWSKKRILEGYLNIAYFGSQAYGIEVAAHRYFSVAAKDLDAGQAATLAGIVRYPSLYDPLINPKESEKRRNFVLQRMADENMISQRQANGFMKKPLKKTLDPSDLTRGCAVSKVPWFCSYVEDSFLENPTYGATRADRRRLLNGGGLTIRTTLQMDDQKAAEAAVEAHLPTGDPSNRVAALAMIEPGTGNVTAMDQNLDYGRGPHATYINNAVDAKYSGSNGQQPGSTFKIFTVAAAIEQGEPMNEGIYAPPSRVMPYGTYENCDGAPLGEWSVQNYTNAPTGTFDIYQGTAYSVNTYFAELAKRVGLCHIWDVAARAGVTTADTGESPLDDPEYQYAPGVIGGGRINMTPLTLAESYATFAARGLHCDARAITSIKTRDGTSVEVPRPVCEQAVKPEVADAVNDVMESVVQGKVPNPTGANMYLGRPTAGKTGTTDDYNAVWFAGYTPNMAAAVWAGHPDAPRRYPMSDVTINGQYYSYVFGSSIPGPIWKDAMLGAVADLPVKNFTPLDPELIDGDQTTLPSLAGLTPEQAAKQLDKLGLRTDVADYDVGSYQPKGTVSYTSPGAGSSVQPGDTITLYLSNGVPPPPSPSPSASENGGGGGTGNGSAGNSGSGAGNGGGGAGNGPGNSDGKPGGGNSNNN
jgi:membrane peptidoglycan carboxypeptidase